MKRYSPVFILATLFFVGFFSCKKINEATELGGDLIPPVDNVTTFEVALNAITDNKLFNDSTKTSFSDDLALGHLSDPVFGNTTADMYFNVSSPFQVYGTYPFINRDSVEIDSVILSLAYVNSYGDTISTQSVSVWEIAQSSGFSDTSLYYYSSTRQAPFATTGSSLGSKTFTIKDLNDSIPLIRKGDTTKVANVLRIPLTNALGQRFTTYDTTKTSAFGGFATDSIFKTLFRGIKVAAESSTGNGGLAYFNLASTNTRLIVYFRATKNGKVDTTAYSFFHNTNGQANIINRNNNGEYAAALNNTDPNDQTLYIQSAPGSYASIVIPSLDTMSNKVIHRAELLAYKIPSGNPASDAIFTPPARLFVDHIRQGAVDTAFLMDKDLPLDFGGNPSFGNFGGTLNPDNSYRFNITRYIQGIVTRNEPNDTLRLHAPLRSYLFSPGINTFYPIEPLEQIANGRVVLAGGAHADPALRLRLRIIYSKL